MKLSAYTTALTAHGITVENIQSIDGLDESSEAHGVLDSLSTILEANGIDTVVAVAETDKGWAMCGIDEDAVHKALLVEGNEINVTDLDLDEEEEDDEEEDEEDEEDEEEEDEEVDEQAVIDSLLDYLDESGVLASVNVNMDAARAFDDARQQGNVMMMLDAVTRMAEDADLEEEQLDEIKKRSMAVQRKMNLSRKRNSRDATKKRANKLRRRMWKKDKSSQMKAKRYQKRHRARWESVEEAYAALDEVFGFGKKKKKAPAGDGGNDLLKQQRDRAARARAKMASHRESVDVDYVVFEAEQEEIDNLLDIADMYGLDRFVDVIAEDDTLTVHIAEELLEAIDIWSEEDLTIEEADATAGKLGKISLRRFVGDTSFLKDAGPSGESALSEEAKPGKEASLGRKDNSYTWTGDAASGVPSPLTGLTAPKAVKPAGGNGARPLKHSKPHDYAHAYDKSIHYTYEDLNSQTLSEMNHLAFRADRDEVLEALVSLAGRVEGRVLWSMAEDEDDNQFVIFFEEQDASLLDAAILGIDIEIDEDFDLMTVLHEMDDEEDDEEEEEDDEDEDDE